MVIIKNILRIINKSIIISLILSSTMCFENMKIRMGIVFLLYSFVFFTTLKKGRD